MSELDDVNRLLCDGASVFESGIILATIRSMGDLVRIVEVCHTGSHQYRGQGADLPLLPSLTRPHGPCDRGLAREERWSDKEKSILEDFRLHAPAYSARDTLAGATYLELAVLAQHHGVPTRLLDWTTNPLAALFFAVEGESAKERRAWCGLSPGTGVGCRKSLINLSPRRFLGLASCFPLIRLRAQVFSLHFYAIGRTRRLILTTSSRKMRICGRSRFRLSANLGSDGCFIATG